MPKYNIIVTNSKETEFEVKQVEGEAIVIDGFENFDFFWFKQVENTTHGNYDVYSITELTTGASVGKGLSLEHAIKTAEKNLNKAGNDKFRNQIKKRSKKIVYPAN